MSKIDLSSTIATMSDGPAADSAITPSTIFPATRVLARAGVAPVPTPATRAAAPALPDAATLGRFVVQGELGRGGMGRVLAVRDPELLRDVALKTLLVEGEVDEVRLARFVAEAQITAQLDHPNIVPIHEMGVTEDGQLFFVMKRVQGRTLRQIVDGLVAGDPQIQQLYGRFFLLMRFGLVCGAVAYAHQRGVLHRDLKPDNIMMGDLGEVLVMDWGVARLMGDADEQIDVEPVGDLKVAHTLDGTSIGTPGYMSPEQCHGRLTELDGRSDVWSLGAILYEMVTLHRAYDAPHAYAMLLETVSGPPVDPRERGVDVDDDLAAIVMRALATDPDQRFASVLELAGALSMYMQGKHEAGVACRDEG